MTLHTISYGGGKQSTALLALRQQGVIPHDTFLFANTGDDSEHPDTITYVREVAAPFAAENGFEVVEVQKTMRDGTKDSILGKIERTEKSEVIPLRSYEDGPPLSRACTVDFKIETLGKWLKKHGASEATPAHVGMGISADEVHRANRKPRPYEFVTYPLLGRRHDDPDCCATDLNVRRVDCPRIIEASPISAALGARLRDIESTLPAETRLSLRKTDFTRLPVAPKSACWFCPHHSFNAWVELRGERPDLFEQSAQLEERLTAKVGSPRFLTRYGKPLREAIPEGVDTLPFDDEDGDCVSGVCAT
jgi:3'-phosphoadenosine 5'-phosphosulfate sulfotransferase (PAPS reductase)/FAD synthetase